MADDLESLDLRSSRALIFSNISIRTRYVLNRCRTEGMCCDTALRMMERKIFLAVGRKSSFARLVFYISTVFVPVFPFQVHAGTMLYRVDSDQTNEDW